MDRIVEWAIIEIDRIWSCANADRLPPALLEVDDEDEDEDDSSRATSRSEPPLASDDMDLDFGTVERVNMVRI